MSKNIGLMDVDCHAESKKWGATVYPNLALAKLARYHKAQGDAVEWYTPFQHYDILYMSKIFTFTPDYDYIINNADQIIKGGTGYDLTTVLPEEVDRLQPDYSIYPNFPKNTAFGFLTRGCIRKCPWCVVPKKEGRIRPYMDVDEIAIEGRDHLVLMDNNILAAGDYAKDQVRKAIERGYHLDFNQAMDARLVTPEWAEILAKVKWIDQRMRFGCDTPRQVEDCERAIRMLDERGFHGHYFLYVMLGGTKDFKESYDIVNHWRTVEVRRRAQHLKGNPVYPYAQPYRDFGNPRQNVPQWQKDMASWVNKRMIFTTCEFKDYQPRKGFKCYEYFN